MLRVVDLQEHRGSINDCRILIVVVTMIDVEIIVLVHRETKNVIMVVMIIITVEVFAMVVMVIITVEVFVMLVMIITVEVVVVVTMATQLKLAQQRQDVVTPLAVILLVVVDFTDLVVKKVVLLVFEVLNEVQ